MAGARLIDISRLASRLGRGPMTGIDRVEWAWVRQLMAADRPVWGLVRSAGGYLLLDRDGLGRFCTLVAEGELPARADWQSRWLWRGDARRARAETAVRKLARGRSWRLGLRRLLAGLGGRFTYFNFGHANLTPRGLAAIKAAGGRVLVMVHDVIPLDHPEFARADTVEGFRRKMAAVAAHADAVIHLTHATRVQTEAQLAALGRVPGGVVAPLGVVVAEAAALPPGLVPEPPYAVVVGTIEPRKNHAVLLDVWDLGREAGHALPRLYVVGGAGWAEPALFARMDATPGVQRIEGLGDGALTGLLQGAVALLAPSLAEGFGLPPMEAAALGVPVIATDLKVTRELLGDYPVYVKPGELYPWLETIEALLRAPGGGQDRAKTVRLPDWDSHFKAVLTLEG